jgi:hypothetical protein
MKDSGRVADRRVHRSTWNRWLLPFLSILIISSTAFVTQAVSSGASSGSFGPAPSGYPIESRCQGMTVSSHVVFVGQEVIGHTNGGICGSAPKDVEWAWSVVPGKGVKGCEVDGTYCEYKATASTDQQYTTLCIDGSNVQGAWESCDYYGVVGDGQGVLYGYVVDKDGGPVAGTTVKAYGAHGATTTSGSDGFYAMQLEKGKYQVEPSGGPQGKASPSYTPKVTSASVEGGKRTEANFILDTSIELKLKLSQSSVVANGYEVVSGTVSTTQYGKPLAGVQVQLEVQPGKTPDEAVTAGARASICYNGSRVWPTSTLNSPDGYPVTVTTDSTGHYDFTLTVGTTPGTWTLDAWAFNADGKLSTDVTAASDTQSVAITTNGSSSLVGFTTELDTAAQATSFSSSLKSNATSASNMATLLSQATKSGTGGINFGGLDYGMTNANDGQTMIIFPEGQPPVVDSKGVIEPLTSNAADLVYDPAEWSGAGLPSTVLNATSLASVVSAVQLTRLPTLAQFDAGASVPGWNTVKGNQLSLFSQNYEYLGWGYPSSTAGACF